MVTNRLVGQELTLTRDQHDQTKTVLKYEQCKGNVRLIVDEICLELQALDINRINSTKWRTIPTMKATIEKKTSVECICRAKGNYFTIAA